MKNIVWAVICSMLLSLVSCGTLSISEMQSETETEKTTENAKTLSVIPFCEATWETTPAELIVLMGRAPDNEYESENYGHVLQYNEVEYDGYTETVKICFENNTMATVLYMFETYEEDIYTHFYEKYVSMYGEPTFINEAGERWDTEDVSVGLLHMNVLNQGYLQCRFLKPVS